MSNNTTEMTKYEFEKVMSNTQELIIFLESNRIDNEEQSSIDVFYLDSLSKILFFHSTGKVQKLFLEISNLTTYLIKRKKINRLNELTKIFTHFDITYSNDLLSYIKLISGQELKEDISNIITTITAVKNPEIYFQISAIRKRLVNDINLIDPLMFIESLFKIIPLFFESEEFQDVLYNYVKRSDDNDLIRAINHYLKDYTGIEEHTKNTKEHVFNRDYVEALYLPPNRKDELLSLVELREKLIDGCESKTEYVNTLFEMAAAYKRLGNNERAFFMAVIVNRLSPGYRNVEVMLKR
ncbi:MULTISPECIES: hypothetical protein [unclassified Halobacteriovorax]|uniref:hypothetical protein n=1 Tax=unclassified Halobacteriovorax TaxID=2639665 RepID=UPI00399ABB5B